MSDSYGDHDPEDAYDAGDTFVDKLDIVRRMVPSIGHELTDGGDRDRMAARFAIAREIVAELRDHPDATAEALAELDDIEVDLDVLSG